MCGIFGTFGGDCVKRTLQALEFLQYRGYDSAGIAALAGDILLYKREGRIRQLAECLPKNICAKAAIGHTRWATHGKVCAQNAHPFLSSDGNFAICHNGIIENYAELRKLVGDVPFTSDTDSEVVAHLLQANYRGDALQAVLKTANMLKGSFALLVLCRHDGKMYAVRHKSPLAADGCGSFSSDVRCLSDKAYVMPDGSVARADDMHTEFFRFDGVRLALSPVKISSAPKPPQGCAMYREICEIPSALERCLDGYEKQKLPPSFCRKVRRIYFIGCGTAYHSGSQACVSAQSFLDVDMRPVYASEFLYGNYPVDNGTLALCISQSGETADTVRAAEKALAQGARVCAVTNTLPSTLSFLCQRCVDIRAGGEYAVASTKAYNCQLLTLLLMLADVADAQKKLSPQKVKKLYEGALSLPHAAEKALLCQNEIARIAHTAAQSSAVFFLGRLEDYPTAQEGSLKLKEISYIHSEAYPSGELKHGTLALMEKGVTAVMVSSCSDLVEKNSAAAKEVQCRGAEVVTVSPYGGVGEIVRIPSVQRYFGGVISVIPLQLLAYHTAVALGRDVDKPRNLAKSVTVE